jgi:hypothetical protein
MVGLILLCLAGFFPLSVLADIPSEQLEFFEARIRPILADRCYACHSAEAEKLKGDLWLDSKDGMLKGGSSGKPAVIPGNAQASRLIAAVRHTDSELKMPPSKSGPKLTEQQISDLVTWVNMGAPDPRTNVVASSASQVSVLEKARAHWAFKAVTTPPVPKVKDARWARTPIDHFILEKLEQGGLRPSEAADKRTLIRRATYDLTGLPPTQEEVDTFLKDKSSAAFERVIDRLLASPHYGERWGRYWLDVARYADTKGYVYGDREETKFVHSYAYRDWVIKALNDDMPYDRFLKLQIAADQVEGADRESLAAMGFLTLGRRFLGVMHDIIDDRIDVVTRGTLGLTVSCARCHDHKYDPIPTKDYYSLYGVFLNSSERTVALNATTAPAKAYIEFENELRRREEKFRTTFNQRRDEVSRQLRNRTRDYLVAVINVEKVNNEVFYEMLGPDDLNPVVIRQWKSYLLSTAQKFNSVWAPWHAFAGLQANEFSSKAASTISAVTASTNKVNALVEKAFTNAPPATMRDVAETYGRLFVDVEKKWTEAPDKSKALSEEETELREILYSPNSPATVPAGAIVDVEWYFIESVRVELAKLAADIDRWIVQAPGAPPHAVILEDKPVLQNAYVFRRGNPSNKGDEAPRQFLEIVAGDERRAFSKGSGRLELAEAIASKGNPLTARVMVNRIWAHHFGAGLVRTPSDFGTRAEQPTHPELLDWLANYFIENGWSQKKLHRLILLSAVYQQSSDVAASGKQRGQLIAAAAIDPENKLLWRFNRQRLDFESLRDSLLFVSGQLDLRMGGKAEDLFKQPFSKRRSIYGFIDRQFMPNPLRVFDFANPDLHNPQRSETTIPQQALFFMNGFFVLEQAKALAQKEVDAKALTSDEKKLSDSIKAIKQLYRSVHQREPTVREVKLASEFLQSSETEKPELAEAPKVPPAWKYGYGEFDENSKTLKGFEMLPHFTGEAWQGGRQWPDATLGWVQLTATGGHAGNDMQHAVIRRWVSPVDGTVTITGDAAHQRAAGQGIRAYVFSERHGQLGRWVLHNDRAAVKIENVEVKRGDTIDFIVSIHQSLNNNDFVWTPVLTMVGPGAIRDANGYAKEWDAKKEFGGMPSEEAQPLTPWEKYAQVLLLSNEFMFVD